MPGLARGRGGRHLSERQRYFLSLEYLHTKCYILVSRNTLTLPFCIGFAKYDASANKCSIMVINVCMFIKSQRRIHIRVPIFVHMKT